MIKDILNITKQIFKVSRAKITATFGVAAAIAVISIGAGVYAGYGPTRPVYDWNNSAEKTGSTQGPVLNSFINTNVYGDERAFVDAKDSSVTTSGGFADQVPVTLGKEYTVRLYVHNNANPSINGNNVSGKGVAKNAKVKVKILPGMANGQGITGYIHADNGLDKNGAPLTDVYDTVDLRNTSTQFSVQYVPGSARIENAAHPSGIALSDTIVTDAGAPIGYSEMDGNLPGCFEYSAYVTIHVKVIAPQSTLNKEVHKAGDTTYAKTASVKPGDTLNWRIFYQNTGSTDLDNVKVRDVLPPHVSVVPGSVRWIFLASDGTTADITQNDTTFFSPGLTFGTWKPNGGFYLRFDTKVLDDFAGCTAGIRNYAFSNSTQVPTEQTSFADVSIAKENCNQVTSFTCDGLDVTKANRTTYNFVTRGSATNTTITGYIFKVNGVVKQDSDSPNFTFVETTPGTYTIASYVKTPAGVTADTPTCAKQVTIEQAPVTPTYSCDLLSAQLVSGRNYKFTTASTAEGGATVKQYLYNFGDNTPELTTTDNVREHEYAQPGTYVASVKVVFNVNGSNQTATSDKCSVTVSIATTPVTPVTPTTPTVLPNTGVGNMLSTFVATTFVGMLAFRAFILRRLF